MTFPVYLPLGPVGVHPHWVFEALADFVGFRLHLWVRRRRGNALPLDRRLAIVAAAILGAALGSKLLFWLSDPWLTWRSIRNPSYILAGKSIVGGLIGGLMAVEWIKRRLGIVRPTGDLFALPLLVGMAVGRIGCFLSGLGDRTHGLPTRLPWGVDFGDGIPRHPTQLYEVAWLGVLAVWLCRLDRRPHREGDLFRASMIGYLSFRLFVEFLKPGVSLAGLTAIQWACLVMLVLYRRTLRPVVGYRKA